MLQLYTPRVNGSRLVHLKIPKRKEKGLKHRHKATIFWVPAVSFRGGIYIYISNMYVCKYIYIYIIFSKCPTLATFPGIPAFNLLLNYQQTSTKQMKQNLAMEIQHLTKKNLKYICGHGRYSCVSYGSKCGFQTGQIWCAWGQCEAIFEPYLYW